MGVDELNHDHASQVLGGLPTVEEMRADVAAAAAAAAQGLDGLRLDWVRVDTDVPIPLILELDACSKLVLSDASGTETVDLYIDIWGEAYDMRYGTSVRLVCGEQRWRLLDTPKAKGEPGRSMWEQGLSRLVEALGQPVPGNELLEVLQAAVHPALQLVWMRMARDATGEAEPK